MNRHIRIVSKGKDTALPQDFALDLELVNPIFNDNVQSGSLPFNIQLEGNRHLVQNLEDVKSDMRAIDLEHTPCMVYVDEVPYHSGELVISEDQELKDSLDASINSYVRSLDEMIDDLECWDVPLKDKIQIGECIGDVTPDYHFVVPIWLSVCLNEDLSGTWDRYEHFENPIDNYSDGSSIQMPAVGFSVPRVWREGSTIKEVAKDGNGQKIVDQDFINTSDPYPTKPYCNARVCYPHYKMNDDGTTSDNIDEKNPYYTLEANRPASGLCFYVLYFLDCLFGKDCLDLSYDNSRLLTVEDMKRLAFFTTHCEYDVERKHTEGSGFDLGSISDINEWLRQRQDGKGIKTGKILTESPKVITKWGDAKDLQKLTIDVHNPPEQDQPGLVAVVGQKLGAYGDDRYVARIQAGLLSFSGTTRANVMKMYANSKNFPNTSVSNIVNSLWASFGIKFILDSEKRSVTPYFIRDVLRNSTTPHLVRGTILSVHKKAEKITGFRMRYAAESDPKDQSKNVRDGVRDYDIAFNYLVEEAGVPIVYQKVDGSVLTYEDILVTGNVQNINLYIDRTTGYAYRWKVDGEAKEINDLNARLFEAAGYKGIAKGDCSKQNEDYVVDVTSNFEPVIFTDVNFYGAKDGTNKQQSLLAAFADVKMSNENEHCKITYALGTSLVDFPLTVQILTDENYDPSSTEEGDSPLGSYDWGNSVGVMRGGGTDATIQYYDHNYDGFGNAKYRTVSGQYAFTSDSIDQWGNEYDYNADVSGIGSGERFSLKITAYKHDEQGNPLTDDQGNILCDDDERDEQTGEITKKVRSRGLFDSFMSDYAHFILERKPLVFRMLCEVAELVDIPNHWDQRFQIGEYVGWINKVKTHVTMEAGLEEVEIEMYCL